jgi:hypothetical protein
MQNNQVGIKITPNRLSMDSINSNSNFEHAGH